MNIGLKGSWLINKIKGYNRILKMAVTGAKNYFPAISRVNPDLVESVPQVDF